MANERFVESAKACIANGRHLLEDAEFLEYSGPPSTMFALSVIAQEEFAKGFLLVLVARGIIPWNPFIYKTTRDHTCKQLLGIVMEYVNPDSDVFLKLMRERNTQNVEALKLLDDLKHTDSKEEQGRIWRRLNEINESRAVLPATVADAINILRHEKIGRRQSAFGRAEDPQYDPLAKMTAEGSIDREKQDALYVRLSRAGEVICSPCSMNVDTAKDAFDRAKRLRELVEQLVDGNTGGLIDYEEIKSVFKALFADLTEETKLMVRKRKEPSS